MMKFQTITAGCILLYLIAPPMMEGQLCASRLIYNGGFGRFYRDGRQCTWYRTCPEKEDICSTCSPANLTAESCPVERCLVYLTNYEAYGNRCGDDACDNVAQCMNCVVNCSLSEIGMTFVPSFRLYYSNALGYFYRAQN